MNRFPLVVLCAILFLAVAVGGGCAYYNTFYNAKQKFAEAERESERNRQQAVTSSAQGAGAQAPRPVPVDRYRKVIEICSKLLEMYPKSKWVDDALLLMGVSYYRMNDLPRAERKFTELMTLFPNSPHVPAAVVWKARTLAEMKEAEAAVAFLNESMPKIKAGPQRAQALYQLARLYLEMEQWPQAVEQYQACLRERQPRDQRMVTLYEAGLAEFHVGDYAAARSAFSEVARVSRDLNQAYEAFVYWSRCEAELGNTGDAETILLRARSAERFVDFAERTDMELGELALRAGRIDDAVAMYEGFIASSGSGEFKGLAFYRLAGIYREQRVNLPLSKALLDSAIHCGAAKDIADSARSALDQISKGLLALNRISELREQIRALESSGAQSRPAEQSVHKPEGPPEESHDLLPSDSLRIQPPDSGASPVSVPSGAPSDSGRRLSPAELASDSILKALRQQAEERKSADTSAPESPQPSPAGENAERTGLSSLHHELQAAYFHIAEFYEFDLADHDSALYYYRLAAADPINKQVFWKANLFLADRLRGPGDSLTAEAEQHYRAVLGADSVPVPAQNRARAALHLPLIEVPPPPQLEALRAVEIAQHSDSLSPDSVLRLYSNVVALDSTTPEARIAWFAKAHIFEDVLQQPDSARVIYSQLLKTSKDSSVVTMLRTKLAPPDSASPFFESDEALFGQKGEAVETLLRPTEEEKGWPPPEESLRGRRFR
jgi:tetratricopeptide (TPR) repeat protein